MVVKTAAKRVDRRADSRAVLLADWMVSKLADEKDPPRAARSAASWVGRSAALSGGKTAAKRVDRRADSRAASSADLMAAN